MYTVTKTYGHDLGLSCCFRQWRADSHCNKLHGYALAFTVVFGCDKLDERNWVVDFGSLKELKADIVRLFDHKTAVALDDPQSAMFSEMEAAGLCEYVFFTNVGCEAFAETVFDLASYHIGDADRERGVRVLSVSCAEHGANSATYAL